ncbi:MAG: hypothetical protein IJY82_03265 [Oscillospiraceae bacterium]|nr:hypothetical protein [Oscillospiraceae bacterium]
MTLLSNIRVAVCGELPTTCNYLLRQGVVKIDQYLDATEIADEAAYHLILIYAPHAEGIFDTVYERKTKSGNGNATVPIRLLNEPACDSALIELRSTLRRIASTQAQSKEAVTDT